MSSKRAHPRHDRTVRLLAAQLEAIASASERSPARQHRLERHVRRAEAATRNAVALDVLSSEEASAIWAEIARRHPGAPWVEDGPSLAA